jgi:HlyD family secretion protein
LAEAEVLAAQAALDELEAGPTAEEVAIAEAQVRQAEAAVRLVDAQIAQLTLTAPMDGIVTSRSAQVGETATAGAPLLTIANLDKVTLVIYVPENRVGQVRLGQEVEVQVDSFPSQVFVGKVSNIAGEAEFTPRNVQTQEERVNLVFAVKVSIPNLDQKLKPGMPADATVLP